MEEESGSRGMSGGRVILLVVLTTIITTLVMLAVLPMLFGLRSYSGAVGRRVVG